MTSNFEQVKDNQWWYSKSSLSSLVQESTAIELSINGRRCVLEQSADGKDGRKTLSFKFIRDDDRFYWQSLNGTQANIELLNVDTSAIYVEEDQEDEYLQTTTDDNQAIKDNSLKFAERSHRELMRKRASTSLFDAYIFVDWSANNVPKRGKDSIWIAEGFWDNEQLVWGPGGRTCTNCPTRDSATEQVRRRLYEHTENSRRVLVCFDFAYAYPQCTESACFGPDHASAAAELNSRISDDPKNSSNRFLVASDLNERINGNSGEGPFWGRPVQGYAGNLPWLKATKPTDWPTRESLKEFRVVEQRLKDKGSRPFSVWQLFGSGSVGSQVLVGLPRIHSLRNDASLSEKSVVWPFETGWVTSFSNEISIVHAEFWPGAIPIDESLHPVRDAAQVLSCVAWAASEDASGGLGAFFDPIARNDQDREIATKEGWILGFTDREGVLHP